MGEYDLDQLDFFRAIFDTVPLEELVPKLFLVDDKFTPRPITLEKALSFYTAKKKGLRLAKRKPKDGHVVFVKVS